MIVDPFSRQYLQHDACFFTLLILVAMECFRRPFWILQWNLSGTPCKVPGRIVVCFSFTHGFSSPIIFLSFSGLCNFRKELRVLFRINREPVLVYVFLPTVDYTDQGQFMQNGAGMRM